MIKTEMYMVKRKFDLSLKLKRSLGMKLSLKWYNIKGNKYQNTCSVISSVSNSKNFTWSKRPACVNLTFYCLWSNENGHNWPLKLKLKIESDEVFTNL